MDYYERLRKLFRKRRLELNMMQTQVAEQADISNNFYSNIERGNTKPSLETVIKICKALNLSLDTIIFDKKMTEDDGDIKQTVEELKYMFKDKTEESLNEMIEMTEALTRMLTKMKK